MTLDNLVKLGRLHNYQPSPVDIQRLIRAARRNLLDAAVVAISCETRFDAAYKALLQTALVALQANGYRPATSEPGHHVTILQSLPKTIGLPSVRLILVDALRKRRNLADYAGQEIDEALMQECIDAASMLLGDVEAWLSAHRPDLTT